MPGPTQLARIPNRPSSAAIASHELLDGRLRRGAQAVADGVAAGRGGRHRDDRAAGLAQRGERGGDHVEGGDRLLVDRRGELRRRHAAQMQLRDVRAGGVDERVEAVGSDLAHERRRRVGVGEVERVRLRPPAEPAHLLADRLGRVRVGAVGEHDVAPARGQQTADLRSEPAAAAGHQRDARPRREVGRLGDGGRVGRAAHSRSTIVTFAWPPPSHIVCRP